MSNGIKYNAPIKSVTLSANSDGKKFLPITIVIANIKIHKYVITLLLSTKKF